MKMSNDNIAAILPADFAGESKVWIYQSTQAFTEAQQKEMDVQLEAFANAWQSHGAKVKGWGKTMFNQFVVLMADEVATGVSGCSTDSSVRLVKSFETQFGLQLFDRMQVALLADDRIQTLPLQNLKIPNTDKKMYYFDNLVASKIEFANNWIKSIDEGWLANKLKVSVK